MTWKKGNYIGGYAMNDGAEYPVYEPGISPGDDDTVNRTSLSLEEAAEYINILENAGRFVLASYMKQVHFMHGMSELERVLGIDASSLVRSES